MVRRSAGLFLLALLVSLPAAATAQPAPLVPAFQYAWGSGGSAPGQFDQVGEVAINSVGAVYVADLNNHRVQVFDSAGNWLGSIHAWSGDTLSRPTGVAIDAQDNVYIAGDDRVVKFDRAGNFLLKWGGFGAAGGQFILLCAVAVAPNGDVYTWDDGFTAFSVQRFTSSGAFLGRWSFGAVNDGGYVSGALAVDAQSHVFALGNTHVYEFDQTGVFLRSWGTAGIGNGQFTRPHGIATDAVGNVYVADWGGSKVQKFASDSTYLAQWCCFSAGGNPPANTGFYQAEGIAVSAQGDVFVSEWGGRRVDRFGGAGLPFVSSAGIGVLQLGLGIVQSPFGVALDATGNVFVADTGHDRIVEFDPTGALLTQWGASGAGNGQFHGPEGLTRSTTGKVYVADTGNNRVQVFSSQGVYAGQWGSLGAANGQFNHPFGIASDGANLVDVVDQGNNRIEQFDGNGVFVATWGTSGTGNGQFSTPYGIAIDANHNVYVVDAGNNRVQKFSASGAYLAQWGSLGSQPGQFNAPHAVAVDGAGNVYVSDQGNSRIEKFSSSGVYLAQWGVSGLPAPQDAREGASRVATAGPDGLAVDTAGNVYRADAVDNELLKYVLPPEIVLIADVPGDAGRRVRLHIHRSSADAATATPRVVGYQVLRRVDPAGTSWEEVGSFVATGAADYVMDAPTLVNAAPGTLVYTTFKVRALTVNPLVSFDSAPGYGGSVDNGGPALDVSRPGAAALALSGSWPNPARGGLLALQFALADGSPAQLELFDLAGRRVAAEDVSALGAGRHVVELSAARGLRPGIYLARLTQQGAARVARIAVLE